MKRIPDSVVRRLPLYLRKLDDLYAAGEERISSGELCRILHLEPSQLRWDMEQFGITPANGITFEIDPLRKAIGEILGTHEDFSAILVGPGKIGSALIEHFDFIINGYKVLGAFDLAPGIVGREVAGVPVYDIETMGDFVRENKVDIAIMTIPRSAAQKVAETLVENGIRAIWNFTNEDLAVGDSGVIVENVHFSDSLLHLNYYLAKKSKE